MSDTVRSFSKGGHSYTYARRRRREPRASGCGMRLFVLFVMAAAAGYFFWATRDSHAMAALIPRDQAYRIYAVDVLAKRDKVAASAFWDLLPESAHLTQAPEQLQSDLGLPEWILNNLFGPFCQLSGDDVDGLSDVLFVTRMQRIGCFVEKLHRFAPGIERDYAGGLRLRHMPDAGLYYAVRGRILAVSPSRAALVRALTLRSEDAVDAETLRAAARDFGADDLCGTMDFTAPGADRAAGDGPALMGGMADVFESLAFSVRLDAQEVRLTGRGALREQWRTRLGGLLPQTPPEPLRMAPEGMLMVSANFGCSVREAWMAAAQAFEDPAAVENLWVKWETVPQLEHPEDGAIAMTGPFYTTLIGPMGPGIRLCWRGVDLNEVMPAPRVIGVFDADVDVAAAAFGALPSPPFDAPPWAMYPRFDAAASRAHLPLPGGPSIQPTAAFYGSSLLAATGKPEADAVLAQPVVVKETEAPAHLFMRVQPHPCVTALYDAAALLADSGLLRGYTPAALREAMTPWLDRTSRIDALTLRLAHEDGALSGAVHMSCTP